MMRCLCWIVFVAICVSSLAAIRQTQKNPITGKAAHADYKQHKPGMLRKITAADPAPSEHVDNGRDYRSESRAAS